jgi:hypothetical protein
LKSFVLREHEYDGQGFEYRAEAFYLIIKAGV